jgi:hypothetical protein
MSRVWTFGDSLTEGFKSTDFWAKTYVKWKGYVPLTHGEIIANKFGYEIINLGRGGSDNYTIFETFCENIEKFEKNDIVIIGWSDVNRFRLHNRNGNWTSILPNFTNDIKNINNISQNTIDEILINRSSDVYVNEVNNWLNVIKKSLIDVKFISWSRFNKGKIKGLYINEKIDLIYRETKGEIKDYHFSELGQKTVAEILINAIGDKSKQKFI